jgi:hypothetical protein
MWHSPLVRRLLPIWMQEHLRVLVALCAAATLVVVAVLTWLVITGGTADQVSSAWTPRCTGATVGTFKGDPMIRARPGARCDLALTIRNESGHTIHVSRLQTPFIGSGGGAELRGLSAAGSTFRDDTSNDPDAKDFPMEEVDGVYSVDLTVPAHADRTVIMRVDWHGGGCHASIVFGVDHWPMVVFETAHRTFHRAADQSLWIRNYEATRDQPGCEDTDN